MASLEYLLTTGVLVVGFLALSEQLIEALGASMAIKSILMSLPLG